MSSVTLWLLFITILLEIEVEKAKCQPHAWTYPEVAVKDIKHEKRVNASCQISAFYRNAMGFSRDWLLREKWTTGFQENLQ